MPRPVTSGSVGTTSRLASGDTSDVWPKTASATGAVPALAATDTATFEAMPVGSRLSSLWRGASRAIIPTKAANDSWKPTSKMAKGFRASTTTAARASTCHWSRPRPTQRPTRTTTIMTADLMMGGDGAHERDHEQRGRRRQQEADPARRAAATGPDRS